MTQLSTFGGVVVPSPTETATVPADLLRIVNQFTGTATTPARTNAIVSTKAERDANYAGYPAGGLVLCPPTKTVWMSLGTVAGVQTWQTLYIDTGWITTGFVLGDNWSVYSTGSVRARRAGQTNYLRVQITYNGTTDIHADDNTDTNPGNITDQVVVSQIPPDFIPKDEWTATFRSTFTGGTALLMTTGMVKLIDMHTDSKIKTAQSVQTQFQWPADD